MLCYIMLHVLIRQHLMMNGEVSNYLDIPQILESIAE